MVGHRYTPHHANTQRKSRRLNRLDYDESARANTNSTPITILYLPQRVQGRHVESHERVPRQSRCQSTTMEQHSGRLLAEVGRSLYLETLGGCQYFPRPRDNNANITTEK